MRCIPLLLGCLAAALPAALAAQDGGRTPRPAAGGAPQVRMPLEGRLEIITTRRARLGVSVNMQARETDSVGAYIQSVTPGGPAAKAGILSGDIITRLNGVPLVTRNIRVGGDQSAPGVALTLLAAGFNAGDSVLVQYRRGKDLKTTMLVAGDEQVWNWGDPGILLRREGPEGAAEEEFARAMRMRVPSESAGGIRREFTIIPRVRSFYFDSPLADLELAPLNPQLGRYFAAKRGVLVINLPRQSPLGLQPGDVIYSVDGRDVANPPHLLRVLQSYAPGEEVKFEIIRNQKKEIVSGMVARP